jgi:hypothetical protein
LVVWAVGGNVGGMGGRRERWWSIAALALMDPVQQNESSLPKPAVGNQKTLSQKHKAEEAQS